MHARKSLLGLAGLSLALLAPVTATLPTPAAVAADTPTVPLLTGGLLTLTGAVGGEYHLRGDDVTQDMTTGPVSFSATWLVNGNYPHTDIPSSDNWPLVDGDRGALSGSPSTVTGSWDRTEAGSMGPRHQSCTTAHQVQPRPSRQYAYIPGNTESFPIRPLDWVGGITSHCEGDDLGYPDMAPLGDYVATAFNEGGIATLPATPWKATHHDVSIPDRSGILAGDTMNLTGAAESLSCALCVSDITFKQLADPTSASRNLAVVPTTGTHDGNVVYVSATVRNAANRSLSIPVTFVDLTTGKPLNQAKGDTLLHTQTFAAGATRTITFAWDTRGTAWKDKQPLPTHTIGVLTQVGGAQRDITVLPRPVVLVHGWNSDASTWQAMKSLITAKDERWPVFAVGDEWSQAGMTMDTDPVSGNSLEVNAKIEARYVEHVRQMTNAQHVDLVVHSMGGLISRTYIDHVMLTQSDPPGNQPLVSHLVMLGTPNQGSACAYAATGAAALFGDAVPTIQLTPAYIIDNFNKSVRQQHGVPFSVDAGTGFPVCFTGDGDGVVTRDSAWWIYPDVGERPGDLHTELPSDPTVLDPWILDHVAKAWFEESAAAGRRAAASAPAISVQQVAVGRPTVRRGHDATMSFPVNASTTLDIDMAMPSTMTALLVDPSGRTVQAQKAGTAAAKNPFRAMRVTKPTRGMWRLRLHNTVATPALSQVSAALHGTKLTQVVAVTPLSNHRLKVVSRLRTHGRRMLGANVHAFIRRQGGIKTTVRLYDDHTHGDAVAGDGIYTIATAPLAKGAYFVLGKAIKGAMTRYVLATSTVR